MKVIGNFHCGKIEKFVGDVLTNDEVKKLGAENVDHLISAGCLEKVLIVEKPEKIKKEKESKEV